MASCSNTYIVKSGAWTQPCLVIGTRIPFIFHKYILARTQKAPWEVHDALYGKEGDSDLWWRWRIESRSHRYWFHQRNAVLHPH